VRPPALRGSLAYNVVTVMLVAALVVAGLLVARLWRSSTVRAEITVSDPAPVGCPTGQHAPACYRFEVTNQGPDSAAVACMVSPSNGVYAEFLSGGASYEYGPELSPGTSFALTAKVVPGSGQTALPPVVGCEPG
jgi:hypothetical protein